MRWVEAVLLFLVGAMPTLGGVALWSGQRLEEDLDPSPRDGVDAVRPASRSTRDAPDDPGACDSVPAVVAARARQGLLRAQIQDLRMRQDEIVGSPIPWPEDLDDAHRPEGVSRVVGLLTAAGLEVNHTDCEEFPCMLRVRAAGAADGPPATPRDVLADAGIEVVQGPRWGPVALESIWVVQVLSPDDLDGFGDQQRRRLGWRRTAIAREDVE